MKVLVFVFTCAPARMKLGVLRYCICSVTVECADAASALEPLRARAIRGSRRGNWISRRRGQKGWLRTSWALHPMAIRIRAALWFVQ